MSKESLIQEKQYQFPYHHLVDMEAVSISRAMISGFEYCGYMRTVLEFIRRTDYRTLLDIGCGDGKMIFELAKESPDKKLVGVDYSHRSILFAKAFNCDHANTEFYEEDVAKIAGVFDVVTVIETLEHIPDDKLSSFAEMVAERVRDGGYLIVSVPTVNFPVQKKHHRHYTHALLDGQLPGFTLREVRYRVREGLWYRFMIRFSNKFDRFLVAQKIAAFVGRKFIFPADCKSGRHLVAIFQKQN